MDTNPTTISHSQYIQMLIQLEACMHDSFPTKHWIRENIGVRPPVVGEPGEYRHQIEDIKKYQMAKLKYGF